MAPNNASFAAYWKLFSRLGGNALINLKRRKTFTITKLEIIVCIFMSFRQPIGPALTFASTAAVSKKPHLSLT